ncbi:MAG: porin family protein [Proteobacteria bacterium]|nr:porin family protein [Pseudomonadota bacterium]
MKNNKLQICGLALALAVFAIPATSTAASEGWYGRFEGGVAVTPNTSKNGSKLTYNSAGWDIGGALGYKYGPMRYEGEVAYQNTGYKSLNGVSNKSRTSVVDVMGNVYYDFDQINDTFVPYLGVGIGYAHLSNGVNVNNGTTTSNTDNRFAYQGIVGFNINLTENVAANIDYRYFGTSNAKNFSGNIFQNNIFNAGLTYYFGN